MKMPRQQASIVYSRQWRAVNMLTVRCRARRLVSVARRAASRGWSGDETRSQPRHQTTEATTVTPTRILILGGGFGGVEAARRLERLLRHRDDVEVTLVSRDNFFLFTPMLHEVAASDVDITHIVSPLRALLHRTRIVVGEVSSVDMAQRVVRVVHGDRAHTHELPYDQLLIALGSTTNFYGLPGLEQQAVTMKTLGDAIHLRNRVIDAL